MATKQGKTIANITILNGGAEVDDELNMVEKSGSWFSHGDQRLGQGRDNARLYLKENPQLSQELEERILRHYGLMAPLTSAPGRVEAAEA